MDLHQKEQWLQVLQAELLAVRQRWDEVASAMERWERLQAEVDRVSPGPGTLALIQPWADVRSELWGAISGLLSAWARASVVLFPSASDASVRGESLRRLLGVSDDDPLRARGLRNDWVHFDERLDEAFAEDPGAIGWSFVDRYDPGSRAELQIVVGEAQVHFRHARAEKVALSELAEHVSAWRNKVRACLMDIRSERAAAEAQAIEGLQSKHDGTLDDESNVVADS